MFYGGENMLKHTQQQRQTQSLHMTPHLRHAIKLLELPNSDLLTYLQDICLDNPLIHIEDTIYKESYEDVDQSVLPPTSRNNSSSNDFLKAPEKTLDEHLHHQIHMAFRDKKESSVALYLLDHLDVNGYLTLSLEEVALTLGLPLSFLESILKKLHSFEPTGVFARNLEECLTLQWIEKGYHPHKLNLFFKEHQSFMKGHMDKLKKALDFNDQDLKQFLNHLKELNPKPGQAFNIPTIPFSSPDLFIYVTDKGLSLRLNDHTHPRLSYDTLSYEGTHKDTETYLKSKQTEAQWLCQALQQRRMNLLKMGHFLMDYQREFFLNNKPLKPLILKTVAEETGLSESTISRLTTSKYAMTPQGLMELKSLFSTGLQAIHQDQEDVSATLVRQELIKLISKEVTPYSDDQLVFELAKKGVNVSRRTIAKYRYLLHIPSSYERKRMSKRQCFDQ